MDADSLATAARDLVARGDAGAAMDLIAQSWRAWLSSGRLAEGLATTAEVLAADGAVDSRRVRVLYADGVLAFRAGDQERSRESNEAALSLARELGDVRGECDALTGLARVALRDGRYDEVVRLATGAVALADQAGDLAARAAPLHLQAAGVRLGGDHAAALGLYLESLALNRELENDGGVAMELHNLGWVELHLGNIDRAERWFGQLERHPVAGDEYLAAWRRLNRAAVTAMRGDRDRAAVMHKEALSAILGLGVQPDPDDQLELDWLIGILNS